MENNVVLSIVKWIAIFIIIVAIIGSGFFTTLIGNTTSLVNDVNKDFLLFLPAQVLVPITIIVLGIIVAIGYVFFD